MKDLYATGVRAADPPVAVSATRPQKHTVVPTPAAPVALSRGDIDAAHHGKPRARRFAASALQSGKAQTTSDLRRLIGEKLRDVDGRQLGRVRMVVADQSLAGGWVVVEEGRGGRRYYLPADRVDGGTGGAWTSLHREQVLATTTIVNGRLTETSERLLRQHYAPTVTDRRHYSELIARERLVRRARASSVVQRAPQRLS
jgi:hypothetical protein